MSNYDVTSPVNEILQRRRRIILFFLLVAVVVAVGCCVYFRRSSRSATDSGNSYGQVISGTSGNMGLATLR